MEIRVPYIAGKALFSLTKPLLNYILNRIAREIITQLAQATATPEWATKNITMRYTLSVYAGEDRKKLLQRMKHGIEHKTLEIESLEESVRRGEEQVYEIPLFDKNLYATVTHEGSHAIRINICARYGAPTDPSEVAEFFGEGGEVILEQINPKVKTEPLEWHEKILREFEDALKLIREVKSDVRHMLEREIDSLDAPSFERYEEVYEIIVEKLSPVKPFFACINRNQLKKFYETGKLWLSGVRKKGRDESAEEKYILVFFPYLCFSEMSAITDIRQEKGRITALKNKDKILDDREGFYFQSAEEVIKKYF